MVNYSFFQVLREDLQHSNVSRSNVIEWVEFEKTKHNKKNGPSTDPWGTPTIRWCNVNSLLVALLPPWSLILPWAWVTVSMSMWDSLGFSRFFQIMPVCELTTLIDCVCMMPGFPFRVPCCLTPSVPRMCCRFTVTLTGTKSVILPPCPQWNLVEPWEYNMTISGDAKVVENGS